MPAVSGAGEARNIQTYSLKGKILKNDISTVLKKKLQTDYKTL